MSSPLIFALRGSTALGEAVAAALGVGLASHEEREFEDGEHACRLQTPVVGRDVYVIHSLHADPIRSVDDRLCRLLFFVSTLRDAGAGRVTAVAPYLCYARQERRKVAGDPVTTRYIATLVEAAGADRVVTMDPHDIAAFENAFRVPATNVEALPLLVSRLARAAEGQAVTVLSPDLGGAKRARAFARDLAEATGRDVPLGHVEKMRDDGVTAGAVVGAEVRGRTVVLVDDVIATGTTLALAARACRERGARVVHAVATHGLFAGGAPALFAEGGPDSVVITNTVDPAPVPPEARVRLEVIDAAPLLAGCIRELHQGAEGPAAIPAAGAIHP